MNHEEDPVPRPLSRAELDNRAKQTAAIRARRRAFQEEFPPGTRVLFRRESTPSDPTIRVGRATVVGLKQTHAGRFVFVRYTLDDDRPSYVRTVSIKTFLYDLPERIPS